MTTQTREQMSDEFQSAVRGVIKTLTHISEWNLAARPGHIDYRNRQQVVDEARTALEKAKPWLEMFV